jgi:secreted trypsin-like serine protease
MTFSGPSLVALFLAIFIFIAKGQNVDVRIVGGNVAADDDYPYFVFWEGCGGTLIHEDIVLTAAHVR